MRMIAFVLIALSTFSLSAQTPEWISYLEKNQAGQEVRHYIRFDHLTIEIKTDMPTGSEQQTFTLDETGETQHWTYQDSSRNSRLEATLAANRQITLSGIHQGQAIQKVFKINEKPWNQPFHQGLSPFLSKPEQKTVFWAIGTRGKGEMKITRFTVVKEPSMPVPPALSRVGFAGPFTQVKIALHGLLSIFWSGRYWYGPGGKQFVFYQGKSSYMDGEVILIKEN